MEIRNGDVVTFKGERVVVIATGIDAGGEPLYCVSDAEANMEWAKRDELTPMAPSIFDNFTIDELKALLAAIRVRRSVAEQGRPLVLSEAQSAALEKFERLLRESG